MIQWTEPQARVYSDSALRQGKMYASKDVIKRWEGQVAEMKMSACYPELLGIDGEPIEFK